MCNVAELVFFTRRLRHTPTLIDFDATPIQIDRMPAYGSGQDSKPMAFLKWRLKQRVFRAATLLHAWSNWAKQSVVNDYHIPADKVVVNPPGVNLQFWKPAPLARSGGKKRIFFVGGDFRRKGRTAKRIRVGSAHPRARRRGNSHYAPSRHAALCRT